MSTTADRCGLPYDSRMADLWGLRVLVEVVDRGSFSAAAEALVLSQPAVSRQVANLERRYGTALFRRLPRGVVPTAAGAAAAELARGIIARVDALESAMQAQTGEVTGALRLAGFSSVNTALVPAAIQRFTAAHPQVRVSLELVDPFEAARGVRTGAVDLALVTEWQLLSDPAAARADRYAEALRVDSVDGVELVPLVDEELWIALPAAHRLAGRRVVRLEDLRDERWIDGAFPDCLGPLAGLTAALGREPDIGFVCDDWSGKQGLVAAGLGVMVVPSLALATVRPEVVLRPTRPALPRRRLHAAVPRPPFRTPATTAMLGALADSVADATGWSSRDAPDRVAATPRGGAVR